MGQPSGQSAWTGQVPRPGSAGAQEFSLGLGSAGLQPMQMSFIHGILHMQPNLPTEEENSSGDSSAVEPGEKLGVATPRLLTLPLKSIFSPGAPSRPEFA